MYVYVCMYVCTHTHTHTQRSVVINYCYRSIVVKSKLPPRSGSSLEVIEPHPQRRGYNVGFFYNKNQFHSPLNGLECG